MSDTPNRAAREAAAQVLRILEAAVRREGRISRSVMPELNRILGFGRSGGGDSRATRAAQLEAVAAWLEGQADG